MAERRTGLLKSPTGQLDPFVSLTIDGAQYMELAHGLYVEVARQAKMFAATTGVAGVAPGTVLTTTPPFTLYNPINSGVYLALVEANMSYHSGTLGDGTVALAGNPSLVQAPPIGGTPLPSQCTFLGFVPGKALVYQGATLAAVPTLLKPMFGMSGGPSQANVMQTQKTLHGMYMLAPGASLSLQGIGTAGTTPLVLMGMTWEEVVI